MGYLIFYFLRDAFTQLSFNTVRISTDAILKHVTSEKNIKLFFN